MSAYPGRQDRTHEGGGGLLEGPFLLPAALFVVMLALTWHRWADPVIDHGRELHVPARLLAGEWLYRDIYYYYGPVAPYAGAALYTLFGVHMNVLHASGIACAAMILALIHWLSRQLLGAWSAALSTCLVLVLCALPPFLGNYIQPYAYAALYGWVFSLLSLACSVRHLSAPSGRGLLAAGIWGAAALACKLELGALTVLPGLTAFAVVCCDERRWVWRPVWQLVVPVVVAACAVYGTILLLVPWRLAVTQTYVSHVQPQMMYFFEGLTGLRYWPDAGWAMVKSGGVCLLACGTTAGIALILDTGRTPSWRRWTIVVAMTIVAGLLAFGATPAIGVPLGIHPLRAAPVVLGVIIVCGAWRVAANWRRHRRSSSRSQVLLVMSVFAFIAITRVILNVSLTTPYTGFTVPMAIVVYAYLFLDGWPALFPTGVRAGVIGAGITVVALIVLCVAYLDVATIRARRDSAIRSPRGTLLTDRSRATAISDAIDFVVSRTRPNETVVTFPEGTIINFLADRPYPLGDEIVVPGYLTEAREREVLRRLRELQVHVMLLVNRPTREYRDIGFGVAYARELKAWIDDHYRPVATFGGSDEGRDDWQFGDPQFFIRAYERVEGCAGAKAPAHEGATSGDCGP